jgi:hypothetical protein
LEDFVNWKQLLGTWGIGLLVSFYTTFVLQTLWNWFAVDGLSAPHVSYWVVYGLVLIIHLIIDEPPIEKQEIFGRLENLINACVPEEKREAVNELLLEDQKGLPSRLGWSLFGQAFGVTLTLGIGWAVHSFLT